MCSRRDAEFLGVDDAGLAGFEEELEVGRLPTVLVESLPEVMPAAQDPHMDRPALAVGEGRHHHVVNAGRYLVAFVKHDAVQVKAHAAVVVRPIDRHPPFVRILDEELGLADPDSGDRGGIAFEVLPGYVLGPYPGRSHEGQSRRVGAVLGG